jgi:hypothetical protein
LLGALAADHEVRVAVAFDVAEHQRRPPRVSREQRDRLAGAAAERPPLEHAARLAHGIADAATRLQHDEVGQTVAVDVTGGQVDHTAELQGLRNRVRERARVVRQHDRRPHQRAAEAEHQLRQRRARDLHGEDATGRHADARQRRGLRHQRTVALVGQQQRRQRVARRQHQVAVAVAVDVDDEATRARVGGRHRHVRRAHVDERAATLCQPQLRPQAVEQHDQVRAAVAVHVGGEHLAGAGRGQPGHGARQHARQRAAAVHHQVDFAVAPQHRHVGQHVARTVEPRNREVAQGDADRHRQRGHRRAHEPPGCRLLQQQLDAVRAQPHQVRETVHVHVGEPQRGHGAERVRQPAGVRLEAGPLRREAGGEAEHSVGAAEGHGVGEDTAGNGCCWLPGRSRPPVAPGHQPHGDEPAIRPDAGACAPQPSDSGAPTRGAPHVHREPEELRPRRPEAGRNASHRRRGARLPQPDHTRRTRVP